MKQKKISMTAHKALAIAPIVSVVLVAVILILGTNIGITLAYASHNDDQRGHPGLPSPRVPPPLSSCPPQCSTCACLVG